MKKLLLFVMLGFMLASCKKDNNAAVNVEPFIADNYSEDARQILFRLLQNGSVTTDKDKPEFNQGELNKILLTIQSVYNLKTRQTDSVFNISKLHIHPYVSLNSIVLQVNNTSADGQKLLTYQQPNNAAFNSLMSKYGFTIYVPNGNVPNYGFVDIRTTTSYNLPALITAFKSYAFIINAQQDGYVGDGSDITYVLSNPSGINISFVAKSGDCPAGCTIQHGWRFHVTADYKATYTGSF